MNAPASSPVVADSGAFARVRELAASAGLTLEQLADLVVDSGLTALPPSDGVTQRYTLEDLGRRLWGDMQQRSPARRAEWFASLGPTQQRAIIVVLRDRGFSSHTIGVEFQISPFEVTRVYNQHADELGAQVVGLRLNTIAGQMQLIAEKAIQEELGKGNGRAAWSIEKDRIAVLQSLGIVESAVHKSEVTHKLDDAARAEIQALVELERKKAAQRQSIKVIEAEVFDAAPAELDDDDG